MDLPVSERLRRGVRAVARAYADPRGWWVTAGLTALAAALRLPHLGWPHALVFDETYYAKDAFSLLRYGYERAFVGPANELLLAGNTAVFRNSPEFVVHPSLGKWAIALGELLFGVNPFGWRIVMALLGIAAVAMLHRTALRLTANVHVAALAGLFMAIDGVAIVLSRTALLDQTLMFFVLATFAALVRDRDWYRHTLVLREYLGTPHRSRALRPWRLAAIVCITCAFATKWSALWFAVGFALLALWWDARARRVHAVTSTPWVADLVWLATAALIGTAGYLLTWVGWFRSDDAWDRNWTDGTDSWLPQSLRALIYYHRQALHFHVTLNSDHPYKASPFGWLLQIRPTSFFYESYQPGKGPCPAGGAQCASEVLALGNVVIWWFGTAVLAALVLNLVARVLRLHFSVGRVAVNGRRTSRVAWDAVAGPLVGVAAGWLPWIYYHERTTFTFYTIVFTPFLCLLAAQGLGLLATRRVRVPAPSAMAIAEDLALDDVFLRHLTAQVLLPEPPVAATASRTLPSGDETATAVQTPAPGLGLEYDEIAPRGFAAAAVIVTLAIAFSAFALPLWTGHPLPYSGWHMRMLFSSWI